MLSGLWAQLRDGSWLTRRRIGIGAGVLLALQLAALLFLIAGTHGWIVPLERATTTDFVSFYAAGSLSNAGTPALAYDHAVHLAAEERIAGVGIEYQFFHYPPVFLLLCAALAKLPYLFAFILFEAATLLFFLTVATQILQERNVVVVVALCAFPIGFWNIGLGQNAFLSAGLFGAATLLIDRRPIGAGLLFGALCYKPQFGLLLPFALAAGGHWRAFAGAALSTATLLLLSFALFGFAAWQAFFAAISASPAMYESGRILFAGMTNPFGAARMLDAAPALSYALQAAASLITLSIVVLVWYRRLSLPVRAAILAAGSIVAAPLALLYDVMLGAIAGLWLLRDRTAPAARGWERTALAVLFLLLLDGRGLAEGLRLPVFPLVVLALFAIAAARAYREMALPQPAIADTGLLRARRGGTPAGAAAPSPPASPPR